MHALLMISDFISAMCSIALEQVSFLTSVSFSISNLSDLSQQRSFFEASVWRRPAAWMIVAVVEELHAFSRLFFTMQRLEKRTTTLPAAEDRETIGVTFSGKLQQTVWNLERTETLTHSYVAGDFWRCALVLLPKIVLWCAVFVAKKHWLIDLCSATQLYAENHTN